jgi:D-alanyl-D-alanine carboxypeptidase/D-alanyl-D-alanine-endopeptidase (penicillin-binding protein 4)
MGNCSGGRDSIATRFQAFSLLVVLLCAVTLANGSADLHAGAETRVLQRIGPADALMLAGPDNHVLLQKNADTPLIPASTLKLVSALAVLATLGPAYRFETHFYTGPDDGTVKIKGFGDPLLISEIVADMAAAVDRAAHRRGLRIRRLLVDDTFFAKPIAIPGNTASTEPYDAPVGAFCVNFNTVNYRIVNGRILSAEPQTPLLPYAKDLVRKTGPGAGGRIVLSHDKEAIALYGAHLCAYFLDRDGSAAIEPVGLAPVNPDTDTRLLVYRSPVALTELVKKMMAFSNNFIANQLVITAGAAAYGAPGTLGKAVRLLETYCRDQLGLEDVTIAEGSGIARQNRLTARALLRVVTEFEPYHDLLRQQDGEYFKTGTLRGIHTRVGYIRRPAGGLYRFVILVNTPGRSAVGIKRGLEDYLKEIRYP